jgi:hypothetical protein
MRCNSTPEGRAIFAEMNRQKGLIDNAGAKLRSSMIYPDPDELALGIEHQRTHAVVLAVEERFYCGRSKGGNFQFAWCIAGAKLFMIKDNDSIRREESALLAKGYAPRRNVVQLVSIVPQGSQ